MRQALGHMAQISLRTRAVMAVYSLREVVREGLEEGKTKDEGEWEGSLQYRWEADVLRRGRNALGPSEYGAGLDYGNFQLSLYRVTLVVWKQGASSPRPESFHYDELVFSRMFQ
jgi:hypothetical protein